MPKSVVIVVSGLPCSGKSTLAVRLQMQCQLPLLAKDTFKETLFDTLGYSDREWSRRVSISAYALLFAQARTLLSCEYSCILEANFRVRQHATEFAQLAMFNARFLQIHCHAHVDVLIGRYRQRVSPDTTTRHPGHVDKLAADEVLQELRTTMQVPLPLPAAAPGDIIDCDTSSEPMLAIDGAIAKLKTLLMAR